MCGWLSAASDARLALEPREPVGIIVNARGQDLDRDVAIEPRVARAIDLAHPADAQHPSISKMLMRRPVSRALAGETRRAATSRAGVASNRAAEARLAEQRLHLGLERRITRARRVERCRTLVHRPCEHLAGQRFNAAPAVARHAAIMRERPSSYAFFAAAAAASPLPAQSHPFTFRAEAMKSEAGKHYPTQDQHKVKLVLRGEGASAARPNREAADFW